MAIDFPDTPTTGDTHTSGGRTWTYDGTGWVVYGPSIDATVLRIDSGNNRVGINNVSPTVTLDVTGDAKVSGNLAVGTVTDVEADITDLQAGATATSIKVYADASARATAVPSPAAGDLSFLTSTASVEVYDGSAWVSVGGAAMITKVARFTASGTWTVPTDVTYAVAHMRGGGGGCSTTGATNATSSSVAFASGTVSAQGGSAMNIGRTFGGAPSSTGRTPKANSGIGANVNHWNNNAGDQQAYAEAEDGSYTVAGAAVTPGASITVTVGAGGTGTRNGGSGYVWIEYQEPA